MCPVLCALTQVDFVLLYLSPDCQCFLFFVDVADWVLYGEPTAHYNILIVMFAPIQFNEAVGFAEVQAGPFQGALPSVVKKAVKQFVRRQAAGS